jgi:hypothetical protein
MNKLPGSFATIRDELVIHVLNVVFRFQKKATWFYLFKACESLQQLECGEFQRSEISRFEQVMARNANIAGRSGKVSTGRGLPAGRIIFWILWIILAIARSAGGCGHSSFSYFPLLRKNTISKTTVSESLKMPEAKKTVS